jgi:hypothetical protein
MNQHRGFNNPRKKENFDDPDKNLYINTSELSLACSITFLSNITWLYHLK